MVRLRGSWIRGRWVELCNCNWSLERIGLDWDWGDIFNCLHHRKRIYISIRPTLHRVIKIWILPSKGANSSLSGSTFPKSRHMNPAFIFFLSCLFACLVISFYFNIRLVVIICRRLLFLESQKNTKRLVHRCKCALFLIFFWWWSMVITIRIPSANTLRTTTSNLTLVKVCMVRARGKEVVQFPYFPAGCIARCTHPEPNWSAPW